MLSADSRVGFIEDLSNEATSARSQLNKKRTFHSLKRGHFSNEDTFLGLSGVAFFISLRNLYLIAAMVHTCMHSIVIRKNRKLCVDFICGFYLCYMCGQWFTAQ